MSKLTNAEKDKLDNTCGNLRVTKLGTHVKSLEDFVNEIPLDTDADTVAEAINELYHMFVNKDCSSIQIPPPGFFTLWGNDEDGKLYCYYNDEEHPPLFRHVETPGEDEGTLYLYIADPEGDNHYEMEIGHYIAVKHLENYYTKAEIDAGYAIKNHAVNAATYGKGTANVFGHLKVANNLTTTSTDAIALAAAQGKVLKGLIDGKADAGHKHDKEDINDFPTKVSAFTNDKGYLTSHQSLADYAKTSYVDQQIANIEGDIEVDFASKADVNHAHGNINKDGVITNQKSKNVVTDSNGKITTEDKLVVDSALSSSSTNPVQNKKVKEALDSINGSSIKLNNSSNISVSDAISNKVDKANGKGLSTNDFTDALKSKLDAIDDEANKYVHPNSHASSMIVEASALNNIGSAKNANQHDINTKINSAFAGKVDKVTGKGLTANDFTDDLKSKLDGIAAGAKAKKRVPGIFVCSDKDKTNQNLVIIDRGTRLKIVLFDQENMVNPVDEYDNIDDFLIPSTSIMYTINGENNLVNSGGTIGINLNPGTYDLLLQFNGSGNYYQVYRSLKLKID